MLSIVFIVDGIITDFTDIPVNAFAPIVSTAFKFNVVIPLHPLNAFVPIVFIVVGN